MGTRSLTFVREKSRGKNKRIKKTPIICMYRQYDGYPSGHGEELANFLKSRQLVNGIGGDKNVFNGPNCLAAMLVAHFKKDAGGIYLYPVTTKDAWQDYVYFVDVDMENFTIELTCQSSYGDNKVLYKGTPEGFEEYLLQPKNEEEE